jgi:uncharacterized protein YidB (DUF937 family)
MGLLDILNSVQNSGVPNDPRARPAPASQSMSPIAKAMLALLALYAAKNVRMGGAPPTQPSQIPSGDVSAGSPGGGLGDLLGGILGGGRPGGSAPGGLGDLLRGPLGGVLGGAAAGTVLNGGLGRLVEQFQQAGHGDAARSWVGTGPNKMISQDDLATALGADTLDTLANQIGMDHHEMVAGLSRQLPGFIDRLTPNGRLPTDEEAQEMV